MSDFIREVDEDYRRDRAVNLLKRFQVPIAVLIVGIIAGAGVWRWWQDSQIAAAEKQNASFQSAIDLARAGKDGEAATAFDAIAKQGAPGYAILSRMMAAQAQAGKDPEAAAKAYDVIANDATLPASVKDTALYRGALLRVDREDPKAFEQRYGRFSIPGFSFHSSIRELLALVALKRGDGAAAERYLDDIITDPGAPAGLRNRAQAFRLLATSGAAQDTTTQPGPAKTLPVGGPPEPASATPPTAPAPATSSVPSLALPNAATPPLAPAPH